MDAQSGKVVASAPICNGTDATSFDPSTRNIFVSCSDGHITVAHLDSPTKLSVVQTIETVRGSRTNAVDPATHRVYVAAVDYQPLAAGAPANARPTAVADSLKVLVYGQK